MRVLHWYPNFQHGGGVANAVAGLARAQADIGVDVAVAALGDSEKPLYGGSIADARVGAISWCASRAVRVGELLVRVPSSRSRSELRSWKPDVVHIHAEFAPDNMWVPQIFDCPIVLSVHGAWHEEIFRKSKTFQKRAYVHFASRLLYKKVSLFHALSPAEARQIEAVQPGARVATIPFGPGAPAHRHRARRGVRDGLKVLYLGRLDSYTKGLDLLLSAFAQAQSEVGRCLGSLTLVGPDWKNSRAELLRQIDALGLQDSVHVPGTVPVSEVGRCFADTDIYVQLSRHDAFPLSVAEALVAGTPTLMSSAVGTTSYDVIRDLPHVRVTSLDRGAAGRALADMAADHGGLVAGSRKADAVVQDFFDWRRIAAEHVDQYARLP